MRDLITKLLNYLITSLPKYLSTVLFRFTLAELKDILQERNSLKVRQYIWGKQEANILVHVFFLCRFSVKLGNKSGFVSGLNII